MQTPYLAIFRLELEKTIVMPDFSISSVCQNVIFLAKRNFLNEGSKLSYSGIFGLELEKATVLWYFISTSSNFSKHKISTKNKILKFGTKTALIGYFRLEFPKLKSYLKSAFWNLFTCKASSKNKKTLNLGPK